MIQKTEAIVLKTQPLRSSSLIVTFATRSFGKIKGVVKGVRKEREVRGAHFELFSHLEIVYYEKLRSDLHLVSDTAMLSSFDGLRTNLSSIAYASYFAELADRVLEVHDPHEEVFELLLFCFRYLSSVKPEHIARIFELKLLAETGLLPSLDVCTGCQKPLPEGGFFSVAQGGLFCTSCRHAASDAQLLPAPVMSALRYYAAHSPDESLRYRPQGEANAALGRLMDGFMLYHLGNPLKSRRFLASIQSVL